MWKMGIMIYILTYFQFFQITDTIPNYFEIVCFYQITLKF